MEISESIQIEIYPLPIQSNISPQNNIQQYYFQTPEINISTFTPSGNDSIYINKSIDPFINAMTGKEECKNTDDKICVKSSVDSEEYLVLNDIHAQKAADHLGTLNQLNQTLINLLHEGLKKNKYNDIDTERVKRLIANYKPNKLFEHKGTGPEDSSFTINKGEEISMCMRDPQSRSVQDLGIISFVNLHEVAHVAAEGYGHEDEFWEAFQFLLKQAYEHDLYTPVDYSKYPETYCGMVVDYNPYFSNNSKGFKE